MTGAPGCCVKDCPNPRDPPFTACSGHQAAFEAEYFPRFTPPEAGFTPWFGDGAVMGRGAPPPPLRVMRWTLRLQLPEVRGLFRSKPSAVGVAVFRTSPDRVAWERLAYVHEETVEAAGRLGALPPVSPRAWLPSGDETSAFILDYPGKRHVCLNLRAPFMPGAEPASDCYVIRIASLTGASLVGADLEDWDGVRP